MPNLTCMAPNFLNFRIVNNESWYSKMTPVDLIGRAGRHLRMGTLLSRTSVQTRLSSAAGMSFTEFSYQLFQAYDWLHLFKTWNCRFQVNQMLGLKNKNLQIIITGWRQ